MIAHATKTSSLSTRLGAALLAASLLAGLACGGASREAPPTLVRLISEPPRGTLMPGSLGEEVTVLDGSFGEGGWTPTGPAGSWRVEEGLLVVESGGAAFDLERAIDLDAAELHALEVTLASSYKVRLSLSWQGRSEAGKPASSWVEPGLVLEYPEGRGDLHRKTFVFDLGSRARWSGPVARLRLRLEPEREGEQIVVRRLRGFRQDLPPEVLAEQVQHPWWVEIDRELRAALVVVPGNQVEREVLVPEESVLEFAIGTTGRLAAPIVLRILAERDRRETALLFETRLEPVEKLAARRWQRAQVDLAAFAGERLRLRVESRAPEGFAAVLGFPVWANPEIVPAGRDIAPNIVLISIDTLRADHLSLYGYAHPTSPRIDSWARRSALVFRNAVAQAPWTLPSHGSLLTGLDALRHGVNHPFRAAPAALETLAERLRGAGYFTAGITGGGWLHPHYGLAQGHDRYRYWLGTDRGDQELEIQAELAGAWLGELREPFFLFFHTYDVHDFLAPGRLAEEGPAPLVAADEDRPEVVRRYDGAVGHMDRLVGGFLEGLESQGLARSTIVVLTSDHGEDLGEDGIFGHGSLRDQVELVPLILALPDGRGAGRTVGEQVRSIDVVPTLLELAGLDVPGDLDGVSLLGLIGSDRGGAPPIASTYFSLRHGLSLRSRDGFKYLYDRSIWEPGEAFFRLPGESPERDNLAPDDPRIETFRALARRLMDERLAGLRIRFDNARSSPFAGTIRGQLIRAGVPKSTDLAGPWMSRVADDVAGFEVPPGRHFQLLFERLGEPRFELTAAVVGNDKDAGEVRTLAIDLETMTLPVSWRWTGAEWKVEATGEPPAEAVAITIEWHAGAGPEGVAPFEHDAELRRQLEALGYLD